MSVATAATIAAVGSVTGGVISAVSAGNAASSQSAAAQSALQAQIQARADAIKQVQSVSGMSAGEMSSINQILSTRSSALTASLQSINQQQTQLNQMSPQVQAAGKDLYDLLTGHASSVLAPMQAQIDQQRAAMQDKLEAQLGPGWQTSSAGINAMMQFNMQSATTLQNAQQNAISNMASTYLGTAGMQMQGQNAVTNATGEAYGRAMTADESVLQANQFVANRQTNAMIGAMGANPIGFQGPTPYAGADSVTGQNIGNVIASTAQGIGQNIAMGGAFSALGGGTGGPNSLSSQIGNFNVGQAIAAPAGVSGGFSSVNPYSRATLSGQ